MHPRYEQEYRLRTNSVERMADIDLSRFSCKKCGQNKPMKGRKSLGWKAGFQCA